MHLRHISPRSMDWLDAVFEGGEERGSYGGGQRGAGALREAGSRPRSRSGGASSRRERGPTALAGPPMSGATQQT
jgi:hypothetical protein